MRYREQLDHPLWQRKRLEVLSASGWKCCRCAADNATLHVHHRRYYPGRLAWEYDATDLEVLCEDCHGNEHKVDRCKTATQLRRQYFLNPDPAFEAERCRQLGELRRRVVA